MLTIGKEVKRMPSIHIDEQGRRTAGTVKGEVIYIHPRGRFHVVQFTFPGGSFRESFLGVEP